MKRRIVIGFDHWFSRAKNGGAVVLVHKGNHGFEYSAPSPATQLAYKAFSLSVNDLRES